MSTRVFWTLPPAGDGRAGDRKLWTRGDLRGAGRRGFPNDLTDAAAGRFGYYDYLFQVARAAEAAGFDGAFIPWDPAGEEPWIVAAAFARDTRRLQLVPELQPAFATPVYLAKMSASYQRLSADRLGWKIDVDRAPDVRRAHGDTLDGDQWLQRADEYLQATRGVWSTRPFEFRGRFYEVQAGGLEGGLSGRRPPPIYTSGQSDTALALAARHADTHLFDGGPPEALRVNASRLDAAAEAAGRKVGRGLRLAVLARHTNEEALAAARHLWSEREDAGNASFDELQVEPLAWSGFRQLGSEAEVGLVGSYEAVARRLEDYVTAGFDTFVLDAQPHVEEAYRLGEHLLPRLSSRFPNVAQAV